MVWNKSLKGFMELKPREMRSARPVDTGTVMTTRRKVFFTAWRKYGSWST